MAKRRSKEKYKRLFDNPQALFPKAEVLLWPNGIPEIWIRSPDGRKGICISSFGEGPAGFGGSIRAFTGTPSITVITGDARYIELCQYNSEPRAQQYKRWYAGLDRHPDETPEQAARRAELDQGAGI